MLGRRSGRLDTRVAAALLVTCGLVVGVSGCSLIGGTAVSKDEATEMNLANQRRVAQKFVSDYSNEELTALRFANEGGRPGLGASWRVNAVATIGGTAFEEILATDFWGGDPLPSAAPGAQPGPLHVTYSDGTSEVLK